jgi:hypothetical protein
MRVALARGMARRRFFFIVSMLRSERADMVMASHDR